MAKENIRPKGQGRSGVQLVPNAPAPIAEVHVRPVIDGLTREGLTRAARDANGKSVYVLPRDMSFLFGRNGNKGWRTAKCSRLDEITLSASGAFCTPSISNRLQYRLQYGVYMVYIP